MAGARHCVAAKFDASSTDVDMATVSGMLVVCDCCAMMIANADTSSCKDYYGHAHDPASLLGKVAAYVEGEAEVWWSRFTWSCDGCGDEYPSGSNRHAAVVLT